MAAKGYCDVEDVEALLQRTFTTAQSAQCAKLIERMETFVDEETGRARSIERLQYAYQAPDGRDEIAI